MALMAIIGITAAGSQGKLRSVSKVVSPAQAVVLGGHLVLLVLLLLQVLQPLLLGDQVGLLSLDLLLLPCCHLSQLLYA